MNYKSTDVDVLKEELKTNVVTFQFTKKDGTTRTARGTLMKEYLPEQIPEIVTFDVEVINTLMVEKNINTIDEYASENGLVFVKTDTSVNPNVYVFSPKKHKRINENLVSYYDIEKDSFRTFITSNFLGIIE